MPQPRVALVTGGNREIGFEICRQLAARGLTVVLTARDEGKGRRAVEELTGGAKGRVLFRRLDVAGPAAPAQLLQEPQTGMGAGYPAYRLSKLALNGLTRILAAELRGANVLVNTMSPGWVQTEMGGA